MVSFLRVLTLGFNEMRCPILNPKNYDPYFGDPQKEDPYLLEAPTLSPAIRKAFLPSKLDTTGMLATRTSPNKDRLLSYYSCGVLNAGLGGGAEILSKP